jgi:hypothetical protein
MNAYAVVGFVVAFGSTAFYCAWTVLESRRVAAKVLAIQQAEARSSGEPVSPKGRARIEARTNTGSS